MVCRVSWEDGRGDYSQLYSFNNIDAAKNTTAGEVLEEELKE